MAYFILFNPLSNNKKGEEVLPQVEALLSGKETTKVNVLEIKDSKDFISKLSSDDKIVLCGGDGTLHKFVNEVYSLNLKQEVLYYPAGSGNDFAHDVENDEKVFEKLIPLNKYFASLPVVKVNGIEKHFINGIGFGIDGYCCEVGDDLREKGEQKINYAGIAIKGLLGKFHPSNAKVTVDGVTKEYKSVWLAPSMIGKYYGGGMKVAPNQDRFNSEKTLSSVVWCGKSKLKTLCAFPSIFTGEHIKHTDMIEIRTGHEITVEFDKPQALQIDGETVRNVTSYSVSYK